MLSSCLHPCFFTDEEIRGNPKAQGHTIQAWPEEEREGGQPVKGTHPPTARRQKPGEENRWDLQHNFLLSLLTMSHP